MPRSKCSCSPAGGFGNTRTAIELCRAAALAGWAAGPIDTDEDPRELARWRGRSMIAVGYAGTRPRLVSDLLKRLLQRDRVGGQRAR